MRSLFFVALVAQVLATVIVLTIAWHSEVNVAVVDHSLQRHVDQRLIDRSLATVVSDTLRNQMVGLWLGGVMLLISTVAHASMRLHRRR